MEVGAHVWLRKEDSHWGWVPAVVSGKVPVQVRNVELIELTLTDDFLEANDNQEDDKFTVKVTVDPEQLKTADHDDVKLRNLPTSFHFAGADPGAGVLCSPNNRIASEIVGGVHDLIGLTHLHEPAILHALRLRYSADIIYTATGPILIAVNPFKRMDHLYNDRIMDQYRRQGEQSNMSTSTYQTPFKHRRGLGERTDQSSGPRLDPHVYSTADDAYRAMMRGMENKELSARFKGKTNQSILVSGESGAGKTVTTKIVLNYFAMLSKLKSENKREDRVSIEQQVLQSNPILEAFGNARTIRNDNSSRFGKYIDIHFTRDGKLSGAKIETYLLEKVRLIHPGAGERNYHVFYQLLSASSTQERRSLGLGTMMHQDFKLLSQSGTYTRRDGVSDQSTHQEMLEAMKTIGFSNTTINSLMRIVTGVLYAGNCSFTSARDGDSCRLNKSEAALNCAEMLGISFEGLAASLTARVILAGDEVVHKPLTLEEATKALEALIKAVYGAMFDYLVERVNTSIVDDQANKASASIGVLDIFGFESFDTNSFEQLCINYTNEALQQQFNKYVFKLEQQEYEKEGIMWKFISFPDNQDVLDLIDKKHTGVLALLDEQCILAQSNDEKFTRYLYGRCDKHTRFNASSSQRVDYLFSIEHYAGFVEYNTESWIEKNKDQLPAASSDLLQSSTFDFMNELNRFVRSEERAGRGTVATKSVSSQFSTQLRVLRSRIDETVPHYVRCLKPNDDLAPDYFEPKNVVEQLRCGGVLEAVRVSRAGYPTRYPHHVFLARYYILADQRDQTPQSPVFSPENQIPEETHLKRLVNKIAFDLWYSEYKVMQALLEAENVDARGKFGSPTKYTERRGMASMPKKVKLHSGPRAPPHNLVVESSVKTPENQRKKRSKADPAAAMRERLERHNVARPESIEEFEDLDFASRCAVAGLQLGRTKVFLRREAFDRIEAMRSDRFHSAAAAVQKLVRGKIARKRFSCMREAAVLIQSLMRMKLSAFRAEGLRYVGATTKIQAAWRGCSARLFFAEILLARRYAAIMIQRTWRLQNERVYRKKEPTEDDIIHAVVSLQAMFRGGKMRRLLEEAANGLFVSPKKVLSPPPRKLPSPSPSPPKVQQRQITPAPSTRDTAVVQSFQAFDLYREIHAENWSMVENILDKNPELAESVDIKTGELALHKIARHASAWTLLVDMVLVLFPKALVHRDHMNALPIHHASAHDNVGALEIIYSAYKEGINDTDKMGRLPIHVAANYDAVETVKFLLSKSPEGAYTMVYRPSAESGGGLPLHIACSNHASIGVITALLAENFASAKRTDENGDLPLHLLLRCGEAVDPVVVKTLLTCFAGALSRTDMHGDLPLAIAIKCACTPAVINSILMQYPEAAGLLNGEGHSPLFLAFKHSSDDRTIMGLLNHAPEQATAVDRKSGLLPIQVATENEHSHFIVHNLLKRDLPIDQSEKVRAQLIPHHYSWNHVVSNTDDLYHQVATKILQSCTQPQVLALAHVEGPDGKIALASATPVCKHEMRVMLRLFNTLEVVNQRPAYTNPVSDTQIFYALRYDPPPQHNGGHYTILHEEKKESGENDYLEDLDDQSHVSAISRHSIRSTLTSRSQHTIEDKLRHIRKEKGQQVIAKLTSRSEIVERELKIRKDYHLSRHYVPAIISVHHTVQHAAYSEAMAEPGYCITMEGADTTAENLMLDMRKQGKRFPGKTLKRIGISLLHMHEHGIIHGDFGTHNIGKFGSRWKLLGVGGSQPIGGETDPTRGFYHPPEAIVVDKQKSAIGKKEAAANIIPIEAQATYDIWAYGVIVYEAIAGLPLTPYACRGKRAMTTVEVAKIGTWDKESLRKALKHIPDDVAARDLLKQLLHPDPNQRLSSMRLALEHPFFTGGNLPKSRGSSSGMASPSTLASSPSHGSRSTSQTRDSQPTSKPNGRRSGGAEVKAINSNESIENRENNVRSSKRAERASSPTGSVRSGRSFGGFRKLRSTLRRQNA